MRLCVERLQHHLAHSKQIRKPEVQVKEFRFYEPGNKLDSSVNHLFQEN